MTDLLEGMLLGSSSSIVSLTTVLGFAVSMVSSVHSVGMGFDPKINGSLSLRITRGPSIEWSYSARLYY